VHVPIPANAKTMCWSDAVMIRTFVRTGCALALFLLSQGGYAAERAVALVIGNASYAVKPLANPVRDAQLVADALVRAGFPKEGVVRHSDLKRKPLRAALEEFVALAANADTALLYFSGHGMQPSSGGESYLIPVDADITSDADLRADAYALSELLAALEALQQRAPKRTVIIVDACRDAPFAAKFKNTRRGLARLESNMPQTLVAYATGYNRVAWDGDGRNGPYALALAAHLTRARERPLLALFDDVKRDVLKRTGHLNPPQQPTRYGDMDTSTYLLGSGPSTSQPGTELARPVAPPAAAPEPVAPPVPRVGDVIRDCAECPEMVVLPSGRFDRGDVHGDGYGNEKPVRTVKIAQPFAIGKYEVTQGEWRAVMGSNPSYFKDCGDRCPVEQVSWEDVQAFIGKLNEKTGKDYRLPSEAEWEYACRAGGRHKWCGSDNVDAVAWYDGNSGGRTHAVGGKRANGWGLHDMSGNVWEWVQDCYEEGYDKGQPVDGRTHEPSTNCARRVIRGGGWYFYLSRNTRSAYRFWYTPDYRFYFLGFRLSRTLP
jgi:formylglycine-generating enzyme required for sulfatase activity